MSRFDLDYPTGTHVPAPADHRFFASGPPERDDRGSQSGSEDGGYAPYADALRAETDTEDDNAALTTQTLNADGTPKRPMNAFMIFARRRRPQVSAENQAMRTGEISKILSKEWNVMPSSEKQFYQDQAKQLKDTFNNRYPDYVYRRRPNNSRKRRKPELGSRTSDNPLPLETGDDLAAYGDVGESPTDADDVPAPDVSPDMHRSRLSHDVHQNYGEQGKFGSSPSRASPYPYVNSDHSFRSNGALDHRSYGSSERAPSSSALPPPGTIHYQYSVPMQSRSHSHSISTPAYDSSGHEPWDVPSVRPASYLGGAHPRSRTPQISQKSYSYSAPSAWQQVPGGQPPSSAGPGFLLPTLNSPYHPPPSLLHSTMSNSTSPDVSAPVSPLPYNPNNPHPPPLKQEYDGHGYPSSPSTASINPYTPNAGDVAPMFSHRQQGQARGLGISSYPPPGAPPAMPHFWRE